jgi:peptidoglycan/xylan/chitin deacetylase (PgdA/CDA1 family)
VESLGKFPDAFGSRVRVALTFDAEHPDRPGCPPGAAETVLDTLEREDVRATFFVQSRWAEAQPSLARRIAEDGHRVGNHSKYHARMPLLSDDGIRTDVTEAEAAIGAITGVDPKPWFRCPFGAGFDDARVLDALEELGYRNVHWDVEPFDWDPTTTAADVTTRTLEGVSAHGDGAVVLLHTWPASTRDALGDTIGALRDAGASFVAVDEVEVLPGTAWP